MTYKYDTLPPLSKQWISFGGNYFNLNLMIKVKASKMAEFNKFLLCGYDCQRNEYVLSGTQFESEELAMEHFKEIIQQSS